MTEQDLGNIISQAQTVAHQAAEKYFQESLGGRDQFACGFAWLNIYEYQGKKIDGRTKIGRQLAALGIRRAYGSSAPQWWNPSRFPCQNVDTLEVGAREAARFLESHGFRAHAGSRLD